MRFHIKALNITAALECEFFERFDPNKASFRTYLRMAVERFAANEHATSQRQKRGGDVIFARIGEHASAPILRNRRLHASGSDSYSVWLSMTHARSVNRTASASIARSLKPTI